MGKTVKYALITLVAVLLLLLIAPFFIPVDNIRQAVEEKASEASGMTVNIQDMSLSLLPVPRLSVTNVTVYDVADGVAKVVVTSGTLSVAVGPLLDSQFELQGISLNGIDLRISEQAKGKGIHVVHIDQVTGSVKLTADQLEMPGWQMKLYGGEVNLNANLMPLDGDERTLNADITGEGIQMKSLLMDASGKGNLTGTLSTRLNVTTRGNSDLVMQRNLFVDGPVRLSHGTLSGMGLEGPAVALVHGKLAAGAIVYDVMKFQLKMRGANRWLNNIMLQSSHLDATGQVHIAASKKINGEIQTSGTAGLSGATLLVGGTTDAPRVFPAPSSLIGGAIGGTIAGPAGAAVGSKVGSAAGNVVEGVGDAVKGFFGN